jgi:coenzyme PQQ biosynthesis protein PqqD
MEAMTGTSTLSRETTPRLAPGVRLHHDKVRNAWILLAPESLIEANPVAVEIIRRIDGTATVGDIIEDLARSFEADRPRIEADVEAFLGTLSAKRLVLL